VALFEFTL